MSTTPDQLQRDLKALRDIQQSYGWTLVIEAIKGDILAASMALADNPVMTEKEIDFRRGAIAAARNFLPVLDVLVARTENELLMATMQQEQPATNPQGALNNG